MKILFFLALYAGIESLEEDDLRKHYGLSFYNKCGNYVKIFNCLTACKSLGYQIFRLNHKCSCSCHEMKTSTFLPFFMWRTNGTTRKVPKTNAPKLYQVVGTLFPPELLSSGEIDTTTVGNITTTRSETNHTTISDSIENSTVNDDLSGTRRKSILRYGFHRTSECLNFEKAYLCIQKCLDLKYDIAYADKKCYCTCYAKKDKAKYTDKSGIQEKWKLGAPTTKLPIWAQKKEKEPETHFEDDIELDHLSGNDTSVSGNQTIADNIMENKTSVSSEVLSENSTAEPLSNSTDLVVKATTIDDNIAVTTVDA
ncbi:unnamed protein product [Pieris macdunnoughi]|uniref:Uncharacterized protein n=1 Tax=Pieris macdunnoughi TaxID=345717 RepID=A0A821LYG4_9NEOP|nr:unnamed protein product [Pieris macdunnoughi]